MHLDLNLLTALDALLDEGSVAGAAARLHVTAPAMSRTLGRIRRVTGDEILVRTGRTMVATAYAQSVRDQVRDLVRQAQDVLSPEREVDLATLDRVFTLRWHDALAASVGPALVTAVHRQAPGVRLRLVAETGSDTTALRRGGADLETASDVPASPEIRHLLAGRDRLVIAVRAGHPLLAGGFDVERYAAASHVIVSRRGRLGDPVDAALAAAGLARTVSLAAPTADIALRVVRDTDLVVAVPDATTRSARAELGLRHLPMPVELPPISLHLTWHQRQDDDRAHIWLREQARSVIAEVFGPAAAL